MSKKLKIFVFIESDFVIRNFIRSHAFDNLIETHDVHYVMPDPGFKRFVVETPLDLFKAPIHRVSIPEYRSLFWKWLFLADQMKPTLNRSVYERRKTYARMIGWKAELMLTAASLPVLNTLFRAYVRKRMAEYPCKELTDLLDAEKPDMLVHPSTFDGCYINDVIAEGKKRSIPSVLIMNSWDNPSLKRSSSGIADWVLVWAEQTKRHTHQFMKVPLDRVIKLGAAQFDLYQRPPAMTRDEFCAEHNIDPKNKIVLYAGSSRQANEIDELKQLDQRIENGELSNVTILYRPHPWGGGGRGGKDIIKTEWKNVVIENSMLSYLQRLSDGDKTPDTADYNRTHVILSSIDALISPFSTIILEGALHGKPVMCLMTDETENIKIRKNLIHFEEIFALETVPTAYQENDLVEEIQSLVDKSNDPKFRKALLKDMEFFVEYSKKPYDIALTEFIEHIVSEPSAT